MTRLIVTHLIQSYFIRLVVGFAVNYEAIFPTTFGFDLDASHNVFGTSFAAPHVSGAMALLLTAFPELTISELEAALIDTAVDLGDVGPDHVYGFGMIDVMAAYRSLLPCIDICLGDFDASGTVDVGDLTVFSAAFGALNGDPNYNAAADFDGNGAVDGTNLAEFIVEFGRIDCPSCN